MRMQKLHDCICLMRYKQ